MHIEEQQKDLPDPESSVLGIENLQDPESGVLVNPDGGSSAQDRNRDEHDASVDVGNHDPPMYVGGNYCVSEDPSSSSYDVWKDSSSRFEHDRTMHVDTQQDNSMYAN
jgi:hypothetical protein